MVGSVPNLTPLVLLLVFLAAVAGYAFCAKDKTRAVAVAFTLGCVGLSAFLIYLIVFAQ